MSHFSLHSYSSSPSHSHDLPSSELAHFRCISNIIHFLICLYSLGLVAHLSSCMSFTGYIYFLLSEEVGEFCCVSDNIHSFMTPKFVCLLHICQHS